MRSVSTHMNFAVSRGNPKTSKDPQGNSGFDQNSAFLNTFKNDYNECQRRSSKGKVMGQQTAKGIETRQLLLDTAMKLFAAQGFAGTTMRSIAQESGLSLGNAYYYFDSKDEIVHELFRGLVQKHRSSVGPLLRPGNNLEANIRLALGNGLKILAPFHEFGPAFIRAAFAESPAEPNEAQRSMEFELWRQVVSASSPLPPLAIRHDLPELLWLIQRGIFLFWAYDTSDEASRSHRLIKNISPVIARLVVLSRLPVVRSILDDLLSLVRSISR